MRRIVVLICMLLTLAWAQVGFNPQPQVQWLRLEEEVVRFITFRTQHLILVGSTPPVRGLERILTGKTLVVVTGEQDRAGLAWLSGQPFTLRLLPGRVNADFLLADDRFLIARRGNKWLLMDHAPTVLILRHQLTQALQSVGR